MFSDFVTGSQAGMTSLALFSNFWIPASRAYAGRLVHTGNDSRYLRNNAACHARRAPYCVDHSFRQGTMGLLLFGHLVVTLILVGLIWTIQLVHYPLMSMVGSEAFASYHSAHSTQITRLVGPLMVVELLTAIALVLSPPSGVSAWAGWLGLGLVVLIWLSTVFLQVPAHEQLSQGFQAEVHRWLVTSNWVRTLAWTARGALLVYLVAPLFVPKV